MSNSEKLAIGRLLGWVAAITTVVVAPWTTLDPINPPKLSMLSIGGFMCWGFLLLNSRFLTSSKFRLPTILCGLFVFDLILVVIFSGSNFNQEFFGTNGRATGFVAYSSLAGLFLAAVATSTHASLNRVSWFLVGTGFLSLTYGIVQAQGIDPIKWVNKYSPVVGFVGNPDFQSSLMGFSGVMAISIAINREITKGIRIALTVYIGLSLFVIKETKAQQGFLVFLGGLAIIGLIWIYKSKLKALTLPLAGVGFFGGTVIVLGSLNMGRLASLLHKASVIYRGDYWRAGWKMTTENPIFGVGLDSYGDWYRRSRTIEAALRRGPDVTSNAAHNVFLDFSSNGGFPLLLIYVALMVLVVRAAFRVIKRNTGFDPVFTGLFSVWVAYQAQSVISLNQIGLAVWGWIISGLIIGYEINSRNESDELRVERSSRKGKSKKLGSAQAVLPSTVVVLFVGLLVGLLVGLPSLVASSKTKSAFESGDLRIIASAIDYFPQDAARANQIAYIFQQNKLEAEALAVLAESVKKYPDSYDAWKLLASLTTASPVQIAEAKAQMKRLDPHNPELK